MAKKLLQIIIYDRHNIPIYQGDISDIGIKNSIIIQKSIEWYNDPAPCYRHREAVRSRIILDLVDDLQKQKTIGNNRVYILSLPVIKRQFFDYYKDASSIELI